MNPFVPEVFSVSNPLWETTALCDRLPDRAMVYERGVDVLNEIATKTVDDGGGSAANTLCALALSGHRVGIVGHVGSDPEGSWAVESLRRRGVITDVRQLEGRRTKRSAIVKECGTDRGYFVVWLPPDSVPPPPPPPAAWFSTSRLMHLDRVSESSPMWAKHRAELGLATSLDLHTCPYRLTAMRNLRELLPYLSILQMSSGAAAELAAHFGETEPVSLVQRLKTVIPWVVITRGSEGALGADKDGLYSARAWAAQVVDSTGAGDAFSASLLHSWLLQIPLDDALRKAAVFGAKACEFLGARGWLPNELVKK